MDGCFTLGLINSLSRPCLFLRCLTGVRYRRLTYLSNWCALWLATAIRVSFDSPCSNGHSHIQPHVIDTHTHASAVHVMMMLAAGFRCGWVAVGWEVRGMGWLVDFSYLGVFVSTREECTKECGLIAVRIMRWRLANIRLNFQSTGSRYSRILCWHTLTSTRSIYIYI